ncbi:MAG: pyridoxamine 5'-phosphate oxidase [Chitinophagaceae bacterium]|nr:pyridoxamine 5'-phosphate oxidase [Chitinophagaceae bacterium]
MSNSIADIRRDYSLRSLLESDVAANPYEQFGKWWSEAINSEVDEVNAMTLATATPDGIPSARIVLLKGYDRNGFVFFTNYNSQKGQDIAANPKACLLFFWKELERQVRIDGNIEKISAAESEEYFQSRPVGSRIGAWCSPQSAVIEDRSVIEKNIAHYEAKFSNQPVPRPEHWGGYIVKPTAIEFWQGRSSRLHDRLRYSLTAESWKIERLAP